MGRHVYLDVFGDRCSSALIMISARLPRVMVDLWHCSLSLVDVNNLAGYMTC